MEHIQEIRSLRKRLEESIKTNEKLRGQLERQGSGLDPGKGEPPQRAVCACEGFVWGALAWIACCVLVSFTLTGGQRGFSPDPDLAACLHGDLAKHCRLFIKWGESSPFYPVAMSQVS